MTSPDVSVIVPSIGSSGLVHGADRVFVLDAVQSVLSTTSDVDVEIIVVAGRTMPPDITDQLSSMPSVRCVPYDADFNFSATVNLGAAHAAAPYLLLLNDDTEAIDDGWLTFMLDAAAGPGVGAVGARLLFEDGTLQHAGHTYRTSLDHVGFGLPGDAAGRDGVLQRRRSVAGVTAACLLTPAAVYDEVGGFSTLLPGNYNDVDYCMKLRHAGYDIVYEPAAALFHFESRSRVAGIKPDEIELIQRRWLSKLIADPFTPAVV
ncbi:MAG: glycosyltransferase [Ilumatobacteraceae bacterium]|nr:glycosyltransferase [Ilumatobacteraceae bacterium]